MDKETKKELIEKDGVLYEAVTLAKDEKDIDSALEKVKKKNPGDVGRVAIIVSHYLDSEKDKTDKKKGVDLSLAALTHSKNIASATKKKIEDYLKFAKADKFLPANQEKLALDPKTTKDDLKKLIGYGNTDEIKKMALFNPNVTEDIIEAVADSDIGGDDGISADAKALRDAAGENIKASRFQEIHNHYSKNENKGKNNVFLNGIERRIAGNQEAPNLLLKKLAKSANKDVAKIAKATIKGVEDANPFEQSDDVSAYGAELSLNKIVGRLHDVAVQAIQQKNSGIVSKLKKFLGKKRAVIDNTGITTTNSGSYFVGVTNNAVFKIRVYESGGFWGGEQAVAEAMALYLKYFAGVDVDVNLKDIKSTDIDKIKDLATQIKDTYGEDANVFEYPYRITYKIYKSGATTTSGLTESMQVVPAKKDNVWLRENVNPFNHSEKIINENHVEKMVKMIESGKNLSAKNELKKFLKEKIKTKISNTLKPKE